MELVSLKNVSKASKIALLKGLGYGYDGVFILDKAGNKVLDPYVDEPVLLDKMLIFPGSTLILDDNFISVASYFEEHGDVLF